MIDWELAHVGDPAEDIGWLCIRSWRFGNDDLPVAGVGALDAFLDAYEAAGGPPSEPERVRWWEALGNVKWAVICARQAHDHLTGAAAEPRAGLARSPDLRAGVGSAELIGSHVTQDRPDAPELLDAVAEFLASEVSEWVPREERFQVLVAANLCAILGRELRAGEAPLHDDLALIGELLEADPPATPPGGVELRDAVRESEAELARRLRAGDLDGDLQAVAARLRDHVRRKLEIARPGYAD